MARILIIEDDEQIRWCYGEMLKGHSLVFTLEEEEIEALVTTVDLVICDYHFSPRLTFERVREIVGKKRPLILCTGDDKPAHSHKVHKFDMFHDLCPLVSGLLEKTPTRVTA